MNSRDKHYSFLPLFQRIKHLVKPNLEWGPGPKHLKVNYGQETQGFNDLPLREESLKPLHQSA